MLVAITSFPRFKQSTRTVEEIRLLRVLYFTNVGGMEFWGIDLR